MSFGLTRTWPGLTVSCFSLRLPKRTETSFLNSENNTRPFSPLGVDAYFPDP